MSMWGYPTSTGQTGLGEHSWTSIVEITNYAAGLLGFGSEVDTHATMITFLVAIDF